MAKRWKAGGIPFYWNAATDTVRVCLVTSTNEMFGGPDPQIAKGEAEKGELPEDTAMREMSEETGINPNNVIASVKLGKIEKKSYTLFVFGYDVLHEVPCIPNWEAVGHWYDIKEAAKLIRGDQQVMLNALMAELKVT